ncbi:MAG TPA: oligosaccharide flippase family protein [Gaiellaceae bacterium]|nr:oligosaccharide flippase family protein [Gaiellaceae bacterium]
MEASPDAHDPSAHAHPIRRLAKDLVVYGGGEVLVRAGGLLTLPIYTRALAADQYGAWGFIVTAVGLLGVVVGLGSDSAYVRYYFRCRSLREKQVLTSTWFGFLAVWTVAVSVALTALAPWTSSWFLGHHSYAFPLALAILSTPLTLMNGMFGEVLRNSFRPVAYTAMNLFGTLALITLTAVFVLVLHKGVTGLALSLDLSLAAALPIRIWLARDHLSRSFSSSLLRRLLRYGWPLVPSSIAYWIFAVSDRFVLAKLADLRAVGLYTVAASITATLGLFQVALSRAWSPHAFKMYEHDPAAASRLFGRVFTYIVLVFGLGCVFVSAFAHEILVVLATPRYYGAAVAVGPLALGYLAYATTQITAGPMTVMERTSYLARIAWAAAGLNLALNIALVPIWGMVASAWATAAAYLFLTIAYIVVGQRLWRVDYDRRRAGTIALLTLVFTVASRVLPGQESPGAVSLKILFVLAFVGGLFAARVVGPSDWHELRAQVRTIEGVGT